MLSYQKNALLALLARFNDLILSYYVNMTAEEQDNKALHVIDRNLTSIEKQIKKL